MTPDSTSEIFRLSLRDVFTDDAFDILQMPRGGFRVMDKQHETCISIRVHENDAQMEVNWLTSCGGGTGTKLLSLIDDLAVVMYPLVTSVMLDDASTLTACDVDIDLAMVKIFTTGMSWYNSKGYFSEDHKQEHTHNLSVIRMPLRVTIHAALTKHQSKFEADNAKAKIQDIIAVELARHKRNGASDVAPPSDVSFLAKLQFNLDNHAQIIEEGRSALCHTMETILNECRSRRIDTDKTTQECLGEIYGRIGRSKSCTDDETSNTAFLVELLKWLKPLVQYESIELTKITDTTTFE